MHVPHKPAMAIMGRHREQWGGSSTLPRCPCWSPGLPSEEAAASAVRRGPKTEESGEFQRVKVKLKRRGDTSGHLWKRLGHGPPRGYYYHLLVQAKKQRLSCPSPLTPIMKSHHKPN